MNQLTDQRLGWFFTSKTHSQRREFYGPGPERCAESDRRSAVSVDPHTSTQTNYCMTTQRGQQLLCSPLIHLGDRLVEKVTMLVNFHEKSKPSRLRSEVTVSMMAEVVLEHQ